MDVIDDTTSNLLWGISGSTGAVFDVNENYAQPRADDWGKFVKVLQDLKQNSSELYDQSINQAPNIFGGQKFKIKT